MRKTRREEGSIEKISRLRWSKELELIRRMIEPLQKVVKEELKLTGYQDIETIKQQAEIYSEFQKDIKKNISQVQHKLILQNPEFEEFLHSEISEILKEIGLYTNRNSRVGFPCLVEYIKLYILSGCGTYLPVKIEKQEHGMKYLQDQALIYKVIENLNRDTLKYATKTAISNMFLRARLHSSKIQVIFGEIPNLITPRITSLMLLTKYIVIRIYQRNMLKKSNK